MDFTYFLKGFIIGFSLPIPIGPVGILCIRRTLTYGKLYGFLTGLSAAISDMAYSIVAAFGITLVSNFISQYQHEIRLVGGVVLLVLGYRTFRPHPVKEEASVKPAIAPALAFFSTFLVTFTNPMALFAYAAVFAGVGIQGLVHNQSAGALFVAGIFLGSLSWFSVLTFLSRFFKEKITTRGLALVNRVAGSLLMLFGMLALWSGLGRL
jgi:threonine/homoserine/homoserine lactone efflux protein